MEYLHTLDEELLKGGVTLSEWCSFIVCQTDEAFVAGANLAAILTAVSGAETYLRSEYSTGAGEKFYTLIEQANIETRLKDDLHALRKYRNKWVHVDDPWDDQDLINQPERYEEELEKMAVFSVRLLRQLIYENQWV